MAKSNKAQQNAQPTTAKKAEEKNMEKNTTTAEQQTATKDTEKKQSRKQRAKAQTTAKADTTSTADEKPKTEPHMVNKDERKYNFIMVKATEELTKANSQTVSTGACKIDGKEFTLPKQTKADNFDNLCKLIQGKILYLNREEAETKKAQIEKRNTEKDTKPTEKDLLDISKYTAVINKCDELLKVHKLKTASITQEPLAKLLAFYITNTHIDISVTDLASALRTNYNIFHNNALTLAQDGKTELTAEQKEQLQTVKASIVATMQQYCNESAWFTAFKLSASAKDCVKFYELSLLDFDIDGKPKFITDLDKTNKSKKLSTALIKWLLAKMKAE